MFSLGFQLLFRSGREALWRLLAIVAGVAIGTVLLLAILSGFTGVNEHDQRTAWEDTTGQPVQQVDSSAQGLLWNANADMFDGQTIKRFDVAASGSAPHIPGVSELPGPGEYFVSPALAKLIQQYPADQLAERFGTDQAGVIGKEGLGSANGLVAVVGQSEAELRRTPNTQLVTAINQEPNTGRGLFLRAVLAVGAVGVLFPAMMFVAVASRLSAARREERFAAIRLIGGTRRQVALLAVVETVVGAVLGVVIGYLFFLFVPSIVANFEFVGIQFYAEYLHVTPLQLIMAIVGIIGGSVGGSMIALKRVDISPLGVARKANPKPPRIWRLIPLLIGVLAILYISVWGGPLNEVTMIGAFLICGIGVFVAGSWITAKIAWILRRFMPGPSALIANSRLLARPTTIFRSVSGVVIAIFVVSAFNTIITSYVNTDNVRRMDLGENALMVQLPAEGIEGQQKSLERTVAELNDQLTSMPGVTSISTFYAVPDTVHLDKITTHLPDSSRTEVQVSPDILVPCDTAKQFKAVTDCVVGQFIAAPSSLLFYSNQSHIPKLQEISADMKELRPTRIAVVTDGTIATRERVRTVVENALGIMAISTTSGELYKEETRIYWQLSQLMNAGVFVTLLVAGCSLMIAIADSLLERKRPFTLLRLTGMSLGQLRWTVILEAAIPLLTISVLSVVIGTIFGGLLLFATVGIDPAMPTWPFIGTIVAGILFSLTVAACALPLLNKLTRPENAQFE